jgi:hypothetical protein
MAFSSVIGASSVIKPGVVTSSTRPSAPFVGQLIFETDTNRLAAYNGSAWVSQSGLQYITGASFTTATSVSFPNNTFTSAYRNYKVIAQITSTTSDANITWRLRAAGADISTSSYDYAMVGIGNNGTSYSSSGIVQTSWDLGAVDSGACWHTATFDIFAPQVTSLTFMSGQYGFVETTGAAYIARNGSMVFRPTTSVDSLSIISSVSSSITGIYRVYGYTEI